MKKIAVFLADGHEECEALLVVDICRRAGITAETLSITGSETVCSSHNVYYKADGLLENADFSDVDMIVLPGGIPGVPNLEMNETVCRLCRSFAEEKMLAAICAAPSLLGKLGILDGKKATVYPGFGDEIPSVEWTGEGVVHDGNIITGRGLGYGINFALEIVKTLCCEEKVKETARKIQYFYG